MPASSYRQDFLDGVALIDAEPRDGAFHVDLLLIHRGRPLHGGRRFTPAAERDIVRRIQRATGFCLW